MWQANKDAASGAHDPQVPSQTAKPVPLLQLFARGDPLGRDDVREVPAHTNLHCRAQLHEAHAKAPRFTRSDHHREVTLSGAIQGVGFGQFIALWLGLALHLKGPDMGYGTDVVGYLAGFAAISVFTTPYWGRLADRVGPRKARVAFAIAQTGVSRCCCRSVATYGCS